MNRKNFKTATLILFTSALAFLSCSEKTDPIPEKGFTEDYFPLHENSKWEYMVESQSLGNDELIESNTEARQVMEEVILNGKTYKKIDGYEAGPKLVRKEGSAYFGIHQDLYQGTTEEFKFLDEDLPVNSSWEFHKSDRSKTEYVIVAKNPSKTIKGIQYEHIIEIAVNYYSKQENDWVKVSTIQHWYAKGIGEIYAFYPYPTLTFSDIHYSLISHQ